MAGLPKRISDKFRIAADGCWMWTASFGTEGYGQVHYEKPAQRAHRVVYMLLVGTIPDGAQLDHTCFNRACVNPDHLRPVTHKQNHEHLQGAYSNSKSGRRGVHWNKVVSKWQVEVVSNGRKHFGGRFHDLDEADLAARALRNKLFTHNDEAPVEVTAA